MPRGHFIIYHNNRPRANKILWKAEYHYKRIINHIGVKNFRPWEEEDEERCLIYLYPSKEAYMAETGAPEWSAGLAHGDITKISLYEGVKEVERSVLPHELTHMLLRELWNKKPIPLWLNEGMAQFEEECEYGIFHRKKRMKNIAKSRAYFKFSELFAMRHVPSDNVTLFYTQSASIIDYLIRGNLRANFGRFLMLIKNGKKADSALKEAFQWKYKNGISSLEERWLDFIGKRY
ncbi:MAG: hypothetical protein U9R52_00510 [Candidatus Omnitrophota bacterium]|nr:hypothetical protein [Candidatus Omnitrophota bacterium]